MHTLLGILLIVLGGIGAYWSLEVKECSGFGCFVFILSYYGMALGFSFIVVGLLPILSLIK